MTRAEPLHVGCDASRADALCVFVHGRGQSPEAMVEAVLDRLDLARVHVALPRALSGAWYDARAVDPLTDATRGQLAAGLDDLARIVASLRAAGGRRPLVLAGFSQGACLAAEYAFLKGREAADGLCLLTGCRVGVASDDRPRSDLPGLPVYASGGDKDTWIPVGAFTAICGELAAAGTRLRAESFPGRPHEVCDAEIAALRAMLARPDSPFGDPT